MTSAHDDFEAFWLHFVRSHTRPATQWMHTAGVVAFCAGAAAALVRRSPWPFVAGGVAFGAMAGAAHPLFEGNRPENAGRPLYGILGNFRMAWHTVRGTMAAEIARSRAGEEAGP